MLIVQAVCHLIPKYVWIAYRRKGVEWYYYRKMEIISATNAELEEVKELNKEIKVLEDRVDNPD